MSCLLGWFNGTCKRPYSGRLSGRARMRIPKLDCTVISTAMRRSQTGRPIRLCCTPRGGQDRYLR
jgi:hypothetical protein